MRAERWGAAMARYRWLVIGVWVVLLGTAGALYPVLQENLTAPNYSVNNAESARVDEIIREKFTRLGAEQDLIVFSAENATVRDPAYRATIRSVLREVRSHPWVTRVIGPFAPGTEDRISADRTAALAVLGLRGTPSQRIERAATLQEAVRHTAEQAPGSIHAWLTGYSPVTHDLSVVERRDVSRAETIALPIAFVVLLLALGTLVAALLPLSLAMAGLLTTFGVLTAVTAWLGLSQFVIAVVSMIGLGIGIDYAMFIVSRFREELRRTGEQRPGRQAVNRAVGTSIATSGRTVAASGLVVAVSLCSLLVVDAPIFRELAIGAAAVVVCTLLVTWTLLPAVLGAIGSRVHKGALPKRFQPADARQDTEAVRGGWARWSAAVMRRPVLAAGSSLALLILATIPVFGMQFGLALGVRTLDDRPTGKAHEVLVEHFSAGAMSPIKVVLPEGQQHPKAVATLRQNLASDERVADLQTVPDPNSATLLISVIPSVPVDSPEAMELVRDLRSPGNLAPRGLAVLVGGATAEFVDLSEETWSAMPLVLGLVLGISLIFLLLVFRSVLLPIKAVLMNLLATGASLGLLVLVFQYGIGASLFGYTSLGYIQVYLPLTVFAFLFGLSMDYEVFLIGRMRESWENTGDNTTAVAAGVQHTARPISAAAAIMVVVFGSFMLSEVPELKQMGFALAAAVAIDATLVRLVLVPALMRLFGHWNWWMPGRNRSTEPNSEPLARL